MRETRGRHRVRRLARYLITRSTAACKRLLARDEHGQARVVKRTYSPGQWHRWYKANQTHRRELRAAKQRGYGKIDPLSCDIPRWAVR